MGMVVKFVNGSRRPSSTIGGNIAEVLHWQKAPADVSWFRIVDLVANLILILHWRVGDHCVWNHWELLSV